MSGVDTGGSCRAQSRHGTTLPKALALALLLAACGKQGRLEPVPPRQAPVKPAAAVRPPTVGEMLQPGPQAAPRRVDDNNAILPERGSDPFNLPPPQ